MSDRVIQRVSSVSYNKCTGCGIWITKYNIIQDKNTLMERNLCDGCTSEDMWSDISMYDMWESQYHHYMIEDFNLKYYTEYTPLYEPHDQAARREIISRYTLTKI